MGIFKRVSILFLVFVLATGCQPEAHVNPNQDAIAISEKLDFGIHSTNSNEESQKRLNVQLDVRSFDSESEALIEAYKLVGKSNHDENQTTVVSSDNFKFLQQLGENQALNNGKNFFVLNDALSRFTQRSADYVKKSYLDDKIGFAIAIYTTAVETVMWIHVAPMSTLAISANVAFTIATAVYFRLNKDNWTKVTDQIKMPMRRFFNDMDQNSVRKKIFYDFMANLGLSSALALVRVPMMSMDQILSEGLTLGLFKLPMIMSIVGTASLFTWAEHQGNIDKDTHPISRFVFRRIGEIRAVLLVTFASTAALLNPGTFGLMPWVTLTVVGVGGMAIYLKAKEINDWIEKSPIFKKLEAVVRMNTVGGGLMCKALFN